MLAALMLSGAMFLSQGVRPPDYSEKSLCDLWAGAQCAVASCGENAQDRCKQESKMCRGKSRSAVGGEHARRVAACAKAKLKLKCGAPTPAECDGVYGP